MIRKVVFKLKHDIANDSELPLAGMELSAVLGADATPIKNLADVLVETDWLGESVQAKAPSRIHDILLRMPYPGAVQAYGAEPVPPTFSIRNLARLTYFRDVFIMFSGEPRQARSPSFVSGSAKMPCRLTRCSPQLGRGCRPRPRSTS